MKQSNTLPPVRLGLFGEETAAEAAGKEGGTGEAPAQSSGGGTGRSDAGSAESSGGLREEFLKLANGKYKAVYTAELQRILSRRFREAKAAEAELRAVRPLTDLLLRRYGIENRDMARLLEAVTNDDPTLAKRAEQNGMPVEQQRHMDALERQVEALRRAEASRQRAEASRQQAEYLRRAAQRWLAESAALRAGDYPDFDLSAEMKSPDFMRLLRAGVPVREAYEVLHRDDILRAVRSAAEADAEKRVVDDIRARGLRPRENGAAAQGSFVVHTDPRKLSREERANIRERVKAGERIVF